MRHCTASAGSPATALEIFRVLDLVFSPYAGNRGLRVHVQLPRQPYPDGELYALDVAGISSASEFLASAPRASVGLIPVQRNPLTGMLFRPIARTVAAVLPKGIETAEMPRPGPSTTLTDSRGRTVLIWTLSAAIGLRTAADRAEFERISHLLDRRAGVAVTESLSPINHASARLHFPLKAVSYGRQAERFDRQQVLFAGAWFSTKSALSAFSEQDLSLLAIARKDARPAYRQFPGGR